MDRALLVARLERLLGLRGDPVKGLSANDWASALESVPREALIRSGIAVVRELILEDWSDRRKDDLRPQRALSAAEAWLAAPGPEALKVVKEAAKECTAARSETYGDTHRIPQAARHIAWTCGADSSEGIFEALQSVEEELLSRIALMSEYHRGPEQRRAIAETLKKTLFPPEPALPATSLAREMGPLPYNAGSHFELGQRIAHKKFGELVVTGVGETWIEAELPDGSKKRLAHKP